MQYSNMDVKQDPEARAEETPLDTIPQDDGQLLAEAPGVKEETSEVNAEPQEAAMDEARRLKELHADVRNQDDLERDITRQVGYTTVED